MKNEEEAESGVMYILKPKKEGDDWIGGAEAVQVKVSKTRDGYKFGTNSQIDKHMLDLPFWDFQFSHLYSTRSKAEEAFKVAVKDRLDQWTELYEKIEKDQKKLKQEIDEWKRFYKTL